MQSNQTWVLYRGGITAATAELKSLGGSTQESQGRVHSVLDRAKTVQKIALLRRSEWRILAWDGIS